MKNFPVAILALSIAAGCTTTRSFNSISASSAEQIEPGRTAVIEFVDGSSEKVKIHSFGQSSLEVVSAADTARSIDYADIRTIYAKELDKRKTAGVVIGGVLVLGLAGLANDLPVGLPSGAPAL